MEVERVHPAHSQLPFSPLSLVVSRRALSPVMLSAVAIRSAALEERVRVTAKPTTKVALEEVAEAVVRDEQFVRLSLMIENWRVCRMHSKVHARLAPG